MWCAITSLTSNGALSPIAPLLVLKKLKKFVTNGAPWMWCAISILTLMAHQHMVRHYYILMAHHMSGAPLVSISSIALFLVVTSPFPNRDPL